MAPPLLTLQNINLNFGATPLLEGAELVIARMARLCLVGRNGSGKSTLLKIAAGLIEPDAGERFLQPKTTIRYLPQEPDFTGFDTVRDYASAGLGPSDDAHRVPYLLEQLGLSGDESPETLSGGEARRAALVRTMAPMPDILLLDEPTNHLDLPAIEWLESELKSMRSALVLISHDRRFLDNLSDTTVWLDRGETKTLNQGFKHFEAWRDKLLEEEVLNAHKLDRKIAREQHWLRYGVTARRKRNVRRLGELYGLREQREQTAQKLSRATSSVKLEASEVTGSGKLMIEAEGISKSFDSNKLIDEFSVRIHRGDRVGIVGPNGSGKTTLLKILTGELAADQGRVRQGVTLDIVYLDQDRSSLNPDWTLKEALARGDGDTVFINGKPRNIAAYAKDFLFLPEQIRTPVSTLSGGERGRLMLARALAQPSNMLVLDEPTNDLDLETLDLLEEMLGSYEGTILLVSHDRDFLDRVVTTTIAAWEPGNWVEYVGGYSAMNAHRNEMKREQGATETSSKRSRQKTTSDKTSTNKSPKRKLSFNEQHALKTLPETMAALEEEIAKHKSRLDEPGLYASDPEAFSTTARALEAAQAHLSEAEDQWLNLELLKEQLGLS